MNQLSRRSFLQGCACSAVAWGMFPWFDLRSALASNGNSTRLLVLNLNGGWDGLSVLQPTGGGVYSALRSLRPTLCQEASGLLSLGNGYGLSPQLSLFKSLYDEGSLLGICNVGYRNMSRSHDESEAAFAQGVADRLRPMSSGYLNRIGAQFGWHSLQAVSVSGPDRVFSGNGYRAVQVNGLERYKFQSDRAVSQAESEQRRDQLYVLSQSWPGDISKSAEEDVLSGVDIVNNTTDTLSDALGAAQFTASYPQTDLGRKFKDADVLFSTGNLGTEVAYIRRGGFDTHSAQLSALPSLLTELNDSFSAFVTNMKAKGIWNNLIVLIVSEFGRTNAENGSAGTDHGGAVPVFVAGGAVRGGQLVGEVLPTDITDNGWLPMRYNIVDVYRQVFAKMNYDPNQVFEASGDAALPGLFS